MHTRFMTLVQVDQILDSEDDSSPLGCCWSKKPRPDGVKEKRHIFIGILAIVCYCENQVF